MSQEVYIYTISDPVTGLVCYIGKTKNPKQRFTKHLTSQKLNTKSCRWIKGLKNKGLKPVFEIIDTCTDSDWQQKERQYIMIFKTLGANLLNQLPGGEGGATMLGRKLNQEQRQKIVDSKIGKHNPTTGKFNIINKGKKINQFDLNGDFIATHDSIRGAATAINRSQRRIQFMLSGKKKVNHVGGFVFTLK